MSRSLKISVSVLAAALLAGGSFYLGRQSSHAPAPGMAGAAPEQKVLYWHDPMVPGQRFDKPGKSPFMDMQLVPVYADNAAGAGDEGGVSVSARVQQNLGIRYASVRRSEAAASFDAVGAVQFDERLNVVVQTRVAGYIEHLSVRAPMERVRKGQALATVFAPEWLGPQNELLALKRSGMSPELITAARERMRAMSIPVDLVRKSEETGTAQARYVISAPADGVVAELAVRDGAAISAGTTMFRIAGLEKVWAVADIPEAQAVHLARGQKVKAVLQADAAQAFDGQLDEILPEINALTRTLKARFVVNNQSGKLTPGMLLRLQVAGPVVARWLVPSEAVIRTGKRAVVIVRKSSGAFEPRDVVLGVDLGEDIEVVSGLNEGEQVVASGQFLIDSEAGLRSALGNMADAVPTDSAAHTGAAADAGLIYKTRGKVESVAADDILISHGPVAALKWPSMTMGFSRPSPNSFMQIKPGDEVSFEFRQGGTLGYELVSVQRLQAGGKP